VGLRSDLDSHRQQTALVDIGLDNGCRQTICLVLLPKTHQDAIMRNSDVKDADGAPGRSFGPCSPAVDAALFLSILSC